MKLVITGCNGRVGKRAVLLALKRGYTVTGIDLTPFSDELAGLIQEDQFGERFTFRQIDLKEYDLVLEALQTSKCEAVVHLAAYPNPDDYKVVTHNCNVVLSWNILRACAELGITRVAQASTVNVIPMIYSVKPLFNYFPLDENHPCEPDEPYGLSKVICELQADTITRRYPTLRIATLRPHWSVPSRTSAQHKEGHDAFHLWGYVQEDSLADAFLLAVTCDTSKWPKKHEAFFVTAPEIAQDDDSGRLRDLHYPDVPIAEGVQLSGRKGFFDCRKAERLLGWVHRDVVSE